MSTESSQYQSYSETLTKSREDKAMTNGEKGKLMRDIENLDSFDHVTIVRIIHETMKKKPYVVCNRNMMMNLDNLTNQCLWKIRYHVDLCLENLRRTDKCKEAEKEHESALNDLDEDLRHQSKLKLTSLTLPGDDDEEPEDGADGMDDECSFDDEMGAELESEDD